MTGGAVSVDLLWIPLGAETYAARFSGLLFERLVAFGRRRRPLDLYHSALRLDLPDGRVVIEMTPVVDAYGERRGVVAEGPVGTSWAGRLRLFRYEIRCWPGGVIADADAAVTTLRVSEDPGRAREVLRLASSVPTPVWGRDEFRTGGMWNSNSVTSWLLESAGIDVAHIRPPPGGRAPGWNAGRIVAGRSFGRL